MPTGQQISVVRSFSSLTKFSKVLKEFQQATNAQSPFTIDKLEVVTDTAGYQGTIRLIISSEASSFLSAPPSVMAAQMAKGLGAGPVDTAALKPLEDALVAAGPAKLYVTIRLPGAVDDATLNGTAGGAIEDNRRAGC